MMPFLPAREGRVTVQPSHKCFDTIVEFVLLAAAETMRQWENVEFTNLTTALDVANVLERTGFRYLIVHGICLFPEPTETIQGTGPPGTPFAHAWIEDDEHDAVILEGLVDGKPTFLSTSRDEFYTTLRVQARTRYTLRGAIHQETQAGHPGPWDQAYRALCRPFTEEDR